MSSFTPELEAAFNRCIEAYYNKARASEQDRFNALAYIKSVESVSKPQDFELFLMTQ